jgi:L-ascorbate metabolism protein UlaG (beta-lactamase superfamily)
MITFNIISTGSKGNAVILNETILIDCGIPYKQLQYHQERLKLVLLTHMHSDHFRPSTVARLSKERPALRWGVPEWMVAPVVDAGVKKQNIDVIRCDTLFTYEGFCSVLCNQTIHNVPNCAWHITLEELKAFYATDTSNLSHIEAPGYDLYLVEANYTEAELVERIAEKQAAGEFVYEYDVINNHLSKENAEDWIYKNAAQHSRYVFLHQHEERKVA